MKLRFVFLGLSITSSWGNGHATTYRALLKSLTERGHDVTFLERDVSYYADNRDLPSPPYARTLLYRSLEELKDRFTGLVRDADLVVMGSYVPDGIEVGAWIHENAPATSAFYDIDTPVTLANVAAGTCEYITGEQIARYALYLSFTGGPTLSTLERELGSPCARPLYCSVDPDLYYPEPIDLRWDLGYLGTYSADRQAALHRLLLEPAKAYPSARFVVAGPQYPAGIAWPENVERIVHLAPREHRKFYNAQRFTLSVTRAAMVRAGWSPSVRLFEAGACGATIITDPWPGLEEFLVPGREIFVARTAIDAHRLIRDLPSAERILAGQRARQKILAEHTSMHRAETLERYTRELLAGHARRSRSMPARARARVSTSN